MTGVTSEEIEIFEPLPSYNYDLIIFEDGGEKVSFTATKIETGGGKLKVTQVVTEKAGFENLTGKYISLRIYSSKPETLFDIYYQVGHLVDTRVSLSGTLIGNPYMEMTFVYEATFDGIHPNGNKEA